VGGFIPPAPYEVNMVERLLKLLISPKFEIDESNTNDWAVGGGLVLSVLAIIFMISSCVVLN